MANEMLNQAVVPTEYRFVPPANPRQEKMIAEQRANAICYHPVPHAGLLQGEERSAVNAAAAPVFEAAAENDGFAQAAPQPPAQQLKKKPGLIKYILLSIITFGIYAIVVMSGISSNINTIASPHDKKKTMHYCLVFFLLTLPTLGIVPLIWYSRLSGRIGNEAKRREIPAAFGKKTFWLWGILGTFILVGPFIYTCKLLKTMNALIADYNQKG